LPTRQVLLIKPVDSMHRRPNFAISIDSEGSVGRLSFGQACVDEPGQFFTSPCVLLAVSDNGRACRRVHVKRHLPSDGGLQWAGTSLPIQIDVSNWHRSRSAMSAFDPERIWAIQTCCDAQRVSAGKPASR
jgi:hypothetical protein